MESKKKGIFSKLLGYFGDDDEDEYQKEKEKEKERLMATKSLPLHFGANIEDPEMPYSYPVDDEDNKSSTPVSEGNGGGDDDDNYHFDNGSSYSAQSAPPIYERKYYGDYDEQEDDDRYEIDDYENDMTSIISSRSLNYGCRMIVTRSIIDGSTGDFKDENRIFVKRGTPCAKFIEVMDAAQYTLETSEYGSIAIHKRETIRIPTTPLQLINMSFLQVWELQEQEEQMRLMEHQAELIRLRGEYSDGEYYDKYDPDEGEDEYVTSSPSSFKNGDEVSSAITEKIGNIVKGVVLSNKNKNNNSDNNNNNNDNHLAKSKKKSDESDENDQHGDNNSSLTSNKNKRLDASKIVQETESSTINESSLFTPAEVFFDTETGKSAASAANLSKDTDEYKKSKGSQQQQQQQQEDDDIERFRERMRREVKEQKKIEKCRKSLSKSPNEIPGTFSGGSLSVDALGSAEYIRSTDPDMFAAATDTTAATTTTFRDDLSMGRIYREYIHRVAWEDCIEITYEEYMLYEQYLLMGLSETMFIMCMRTWLDISRQNGKYYGGGYMLTNPEYVTNLHIPYTPEHAENLKNSSVTKYPCRNPDPIQDFSEYMDSVFLKQQSPDVKHENGFWIKKIHDEINNGHHHHTHDQPEQHQDKTNIEEMGKNIANAISYNVFESYVEKIVLEAEHRMPNSIAVVSQMMAVCNGVTDLYKHIEAQERPPGTMAPTTTYVSPEPSYHETKTKTTKHSNFKSSKDQQGDHQHINSGNSEENGKKRNPLLDAFVNTSDDTTVNVSMYRLKNLYKQVEQLNKMISLNIDTFGQHITMTGPKYDNIP